MTFQEELTLLIVDKIALGALIGIIAFIANGIIERIRLRHSIHTEIAKLRINYISKYWQDYQCIIGKIEDIHLSAMAIEHRITKEMPIEEVIKLLQEHKVSKETIKKYNIELLPRIKVVQNDIITLEKYFENNRFWLGDKIYKRLAKAWDNLYDYAYLIKTKRLSKDNNISVELYKASYKAMRLREDVFSYIKDL
jgi:hypothetical protein